MFQHIMLIVLALTPQWVPGGITFYYGPQFEGSSLKCDEPYGQRYFYEEETGPWIALDISWYEQGLVQCGDLFLVEFYDGSRMLARALDSGRLDYRIWPRSVPVWDTGLPIIADLPLYWRNGRETATGRILNISAMLRQWKIHGTGRKPGFRESRRR